MSIQKKERERGHQRHPADVVTAARPDGGPDVLHRRGFAAFEEAGDRVERKRDERGDQCEAHGQRINKIRQV
jgi:hypothetical protein